MIHRTRHTQMRAPAELLRFPNLFVPNSAPDPLLALLKSACCEHSSQSMHSLRLRRSYQRNACAIR
jgi:hypothetical protein